MRYALDSFPIPLCDFKRAPASTSPLKCADGTGILILPYCLRIWMIEKCFPYYVNEAPILLSSGTKGISEEVEIDLRKTYNVCLLPTRRRNQREQYPDRFRKLHVRVRRRVETTISQLTKFHGYVPGRTGNFERA